MKAKIKATGEIVYGNAIVSFQGDDFYLDELEFLDNDLDYWTRLKHQYAGMAMAGICANPSYDEVSYATMADDAIRSATALVEKLKEESKK